MRYQHTQIETHFKVLTCNDRQLAPLDVRKSGIYVDNITACKIEVFIKPHVETQNVFAFTCLVYSTLQTENVSRHANKKFKR